MNSRVGCGWAAASFNLPRPDVRQSRARSGVVLSHVSSLPLTNIDRPVKGVPGPRSGTDSVAIDSEQFRQGRPTDAILGVASPGRAVGGCRSFSVHAVSVGSRLRRRRMNGTRV